MIRHIVPDNNNDGTNVGLDNQRFSGGNFQTFTVGGRKVSTVASYSETISQTVGSASYCLAAIASPVNGQSIEFLNGDSVLVRYIFILGDANATNDPLTVRDNTNTGCWYLISSFDVVGNISDFQTWQFPNGIITTNINLQGASPSFGGNGVAFYLGGGRLGNFTTVASGLGANGLVGSRYVRFHGASANISQPLPPIGNPVDGGHVLPGYECFLWNDDATTHTVTVSINGTNVVLQPGDRMFVRAAAQAGQLGAISDYWDYSVSTSLGRSLAAIAAPAAGRALLGIPAALSITAPKTANYAAAANELAIMDLTGGSYGVTLPAAPSDGTTVGVKIIGLSAGYSCTVSTSGSDVFTKTGGTTTENLKTLYEAAIFQYKASTGIWTIVSNDVSISQLDLRYPSITSLPGRFSAGSLAWAATETINFNAAAFYTIALTGATTFASSNLTAGATVTIRLQAASSQNLTFPAAWVFLGSTPPTQLLAGKTALLSLTSFGTTDADVVAAYATQP